MRSSKVFIITLCLLILPIFTAQAVTGIGSIKQKKSLNRAGVSAHGELQADGSIRLYYSSAAARGTAIESCSKSGACSQIGTIPGINDLTTVTLQDGTKRAYFVSPNVQSGVKSIATAAMSADGLSLGAISSTGVATAIDAKAWGVPDAVVLPDGRVRIYYVNKRSKGEINLSMTSTDATGVNFVADRGTRTTGGLVDFEVLQAVSGDWIAIASTTPGAPPQKLYLGTSKDGLKWNFKKTNLMPANKNYLDPAGVKIGKNKFLLYYTSSPKSNPFDGFNLEQGVLTVR